MLSRQKRRLSHFYRPNEAIFWHALYFLLPSTVKNDKDFAIGQIP